MVSMVFFVRLSPLKNNKTVKNVCVAHLKFYISALSLSRNVSQNFFFMCYRTDIAITFYFALKRTNDEEIERERNAFVTFTLSRLLFTTLFNFVPL